MRSPRCRIPALARVFAVMAALAAAAIPVSAQAASALAAPAKDWAVTIDTRDIGAKAKFYQYKTPGGRTVELFAVKASDGTVRTALNTCQVCYSSGRGYYVQENDVFICQNCGNRFSLDQIEKIKGGCNPIPILGADKTVSGNSILISKEYLTRVSPYFANWKKGR